MFCRHAYASVVHSRESTRLRGRSLRTRVCFGRDRPPRRFRESRAPRFRESRALRFRDRSFFRKKRNEKLYYRTPETYVVLTDEVMFFRDGRG